MALTRDSILATATKPLPIVQIEVPGLDEPVFIKAMSGLERDDWEQSLRVQRGEDFSVNTANIRGRLAARCWVDANGVRLFRDEDAFALGGLPAAMLDKIYITAQRLCGVGVDDTKALKNDSAGAAGTASPTN